MFLDPISEAIAHFIGHFNLLSEQARMREAYDRIKAVADEEHDTDPLGNIDAAGTQDHELVDFDPGVRYVDSGDPIPPGAVMPVGGFYQPQMPDLGRLGVPEPANPDLLRVAAGGGGGGSLQFMVEPPSILAALIKQDIWLADHDYFNNSDIKIEPLDAEEAWRQLTALAGKAKTLDWFDDQADLSAEDGIGDFMMSARDGLDHFDQPYEGDASVSVLHEASLSGSWVNGQTATELPSYVANLPPSLQPTDDENGQGPINALETGGFHDLSAGSNMMINQAGLASSWIVSPVILVNGDSVNLDVISQINVIHDVDSNGAGAGFGSGPAQANGLFNIASFNVLSNPVNGPAGEPGEPLIFPQDWAVTTIDGNIVFLNWIEQYSLMSDGDTTVLSASGSATVTVSGGNLAINDVSLLDLGHYYDLIIIGGDIYHANIINQLNLLLDDDHIWTLGEHPVQAGGTIGTGENLLWNQAAINKFGTMNFEGLDGDYLQTLQNFLSGDETIEDGVLMDSAFAGLGALRVLYVTGDMLDLQYLKQTNILGDQDQVALAGELLQASGQADWTIETGENALANFATITDAGVDATIHVGGEQYSDALLYQAELISTEPLPGSGDPLALANEAVAFLADDVTVQDNGEGGNQSYIYAEETPADIMQTVLA